MTDMPQFHFEVEPLTSPACPPGCLEAGVNRIAAGFAALAVETGAVPAATAEGQQSPSEVLCQVRCEGPESRGMLRRRACGMVASLQLFDDRESVVLEGVFHNDA